MRERGRPSERKTRPLRELFLYLCYCCLPAELSWRETVYICVRAGQKVTQTAARVHPPSQRVTFYHVSATVTHFQQPLPSLPPLHSPFSLHFSILLHPITLTTLSITALLLLWKKEKKGSFEETGLIWCHDNKNTYEAVNLTENRVTKSCCDPVIKKGLASTSSRLFATRLQAAYAHLSITAHLAVFAARL